MDTELFCFLKSHWQDTKDLFNSVFVTTILGSLVGAFAGAYGAQRIAERSKKRDELVKEIRNTNATISVAYGICESFLSLKKQHVKSLKEKFDGQKSQLEEFFVKRNGGQISKEAVFEFRTDYQTLSLPPVPVDILQKQVFEELSLTGRPLNVVTVLSQTVYGLSAALEKRNQLIETYKATTPNTTMTLHLYFGIPYGEGHVNADYPATIDAIYNQTEDGIFFSQLLCKDLVEHGKMLAATFKKEFGKGEPAISKPDFANADKAGLMPSADNYADWTNAFIKHPDSTTGK